MEIERYVIPFAIYNAGEAKWGYTTWGLMVGWMLYDIKDYWVQKNWLMFMHHVVTLFILYWLMFFEDEELFQGWAPVAGTLELAGCGTTVYSNLSTRGYWDKMLLLSVYTPLRFWYVPHMLMDLGAAGACRVPLGCVWVIVCMSMWWIKGIFLSALAGTIRRIQPTIQYLESS